MKKILSGIAFLGLLFFGFYLVSGQQPLIKPVYVRIANLLDVATTAPTDNYVLTYDAATGLWGPEESSAVAGASYGDDVQAKWGTDEDFSIQYDENGDDTAQLSLPSDGLSLRTSATDADNALLIKVAKVTRAHNSALFDANGLSDSAIVWQQPANSVLLSAKYVLDVQFADGSLTDIDVELGDAGDNDGVINVTGNLTSDAVGTEYSTRGAYWSATTAGGYHSASAKDWTAYATSTGADLDTTSGGQITFYFAYIQF